MQRIPLRAIVAIAAVGVACTAGEGPGPAAAGDAVRGGELFTANCAACHGPAGLGTTTGPPLLHELYVPSHHADESFQRAVANGVQPHHWKFGPMPPVPGLEPADVADIIAHVRQLQRDAGIVE